MADRSSTSSRIAMRFGGSSNGSSSRTPSRPEPSSTNGRRHRAAPALHAGDSSDDENDDTEGRHETITEFGPDGASSSSSRRDRPRSRSPRDSRRDPRGYRDRSRSRDRTSSARDTPQAHEDAPKQYGLIINKNPRQPKPDSSKPSPKASNPPSPPPKPKSADEEALASLLGDSQPKSLLTKRAEGSEPDDLEPDPEDYSRVPIDDFGAHLLRGFGWDGKMKGQVGQVKKHSNLAGLGAKTKGAEELDAWMQKRKNDERGGGGRGPKERRPRADEYRMEEERRKARREERQRETDRPRDDRDRGYREREREYRERERERDGRRR